MLLLENLIKTWELNGNKIFFYPLILSFAGSILFGLIIGKLPEIYSVPLYALLFGVLSGILNKLFDIDSVISPNFILTIAILLISILALFGGLYFGKIFLPIIVANILFSMCLFYVDSIFYGESIHNSLISLYFLSGMLAISLFYILILVDWQTNTGCPYIIAYSVIIYIYLQTSLLCRLILICSNTT